MCLKLALLGLIRVYMRTTMGRQGSSIWPSASRIVLYLESLGNNDGGGYENVTKLERIQFVKC